MDNAAFIFMGILMGIIFGFSLEKSGVLDPETIIGQLQLRRFTMLRVFLSAIVTGLIVYLILYFMGYERLNWKVMSLGPDIVGGIILGTGIAFAGACPGTVFGQIGVGYKDSIIVLFGAIIGAYAFLKWGNHLIALLPKEPSEKHTLDSILNISYVATNILMSSFFTGALFLMRRLPS